MKCSIRATWSVFLLLCLTIVMVACGRYAGRPTIQTDLAPIAVPAAAEAVDRVDRFGNDVDAAVNDYRIDPRGDLYERHSPDTEVPKLGTPST